MNEILKNFFIYFMPVLISLSALILVTRLKKLWTQQPLLVIDNNDVINISSYPALNVKIALLYDKDPYIMSNDFGKNEYKLQNVVDTPALRSNKKVSVKEYIGFACDVGNSIFVIEYEDIESNIYRSFFASNSYKGGNGGSIKVKRIKWRKKILSMNKEFTIAKLDRSTIRELRKRLIIR